MTDITDHYPIFHINRQITAYETEIYMERRLYNQRNKQAFLEALQKQIGVIYTAFLEHRAALIYFIVSLCHC